MSLAVHLEQPSKRGRGGTVAPLGTVAAHGLLLEEPKPSPGGLFLWIKLG